MCHRRTRQSQDASRSSRPRTRCPTRPAGGAAQRIVELAQGLTADDLVLCLISGGGSALLSLPAPGLTLEDKQAINKALLNSGAAIDEMNCVRKHLSAIKGGRLAARCAPARVVTLLISDVPGDDPSVIASGPTVPDATTCADALRILARYGIAIPAGAARGPGERRVRDAQARRSAASPATQVHLIATPQQSLEAAAALARATRASPRTSSATRSRANRARSARCMPRWRAPWRGAARRSPSPACILSGGETTVTVKSKGVRSAVPGSPGRGGRATEFLLGCAIALQGEPGVLGAGGRHRRHRRHRGQRRRHRHAGHAGACRARWA